MKRAITALALIGALLLSIVACQIYNPKDNSTMYTAMRTEGAISKVDYSKKFEKADPDGKYEILKEYETFRKIFKDKQKWIEAFNSADENGNLEKPYSNDYVTLSSIYGTKEQLEALWDKEFDVLWDFNGKL